MGISYFFKNNTRREIVRTHLNDITKNILIAINDYSWNISDEIDIVNDFDENIEQYVEQGFTIDYAFWLA